MPLTRKGYKIKRRMMQLKSKGGYGKRKGERIFYAAQNKGTIKRTHRKRK